MDGKPCTVLEVGSMGRRVLTTGVAGLCDLAGMVTYVPPDAEAIRAAIRAEPYEFNSALQNYVRRRHAVNVVLSNIERVARERIVTLDPV
jgi:hypothetical protein